LLEEVRRGIVKVMRTKSLVEVARTKRNVEVARLRSCLVKVLSNYNRLSLISSSGSSIARLRSSTAFKSFFLGPICIPNTFKSYTIILSLLVPIVHREPL